jgi:lysozyme
MAKKNSIPKGVFKKNTPKKKVLSTSKPVYKIASYWRIIAGLFVVLFFIGSIYTYRAKAEKKKRKQLTSLVHDIPKGFKSVGLDVSHHQGEIDWAQFLTIYKYDTLVDFVYAKATEGTSHIDREWRNNRKALMKQKIKNGAYHFFLPNRDPEKQAKHFLANYTYNTSDLPPVLDVESEGNSDKKLLSDIKIWCEIVENETKIKPVIYTSLHFFETKFNDSFLEYDFWIAAYSQRPENALKDDRVIHWQFSESGRLPISEGEVDLNVSFLKM